jgi:hypothetical protein
VFYGVLVIIGYGVDEILVVKEVSLANNEGRYLHRTNYGNS